MSLSPNQLFAPLVALVIASLVLMGAGVFAWGAQSEVSPDDWLPTFAGVFVAGFILVGTLYCIRQLQGRTAKPYHVRSPKVIVGGVACALLIGFALLSALQVGNHQRYENHQFTKDLSFEGVGDPSLEPRGFVVSIIVVCFPGPVSWLIYGMKRFYVDAIEEVATDVEGTDPMGQIMRSA